MPTTRLMEAPTRKEVWIPIRPINHDPTTSVPTTALSLQSSAASAPFNARTTVTAPTVAAAIPHIWLSAPKSTDNANGRRCAPSTWSSPVSARRFGGASASVPVRHSRDSATAVIGPPPRSRRGR